MFCLKFRNDTDSGLRMKIAIPKNPPRQSDSLADDTNANRKTVNKESRESMSDRKTMQNMLSKKHRHDSTSNSSCCSACTESDDDSDSSSLCSKNQQTPKSLKHNANSKHHKNSNATRRNASAKRVQQKANIETSDSNSDSSDESSDSEPIENRSPVSKKTYKNDFLKSATNQNLNADGASSSDMELPALVMAAIQRVESCSDGENSKIEQKSSTQYTSSLLRDFVAKTQMMGSNIQNSNQMINSKKDPNHSNNDKAAATAKTIANVEESNETVKKKRGRPRKNPLPNTNESASVNNGSPDSGITSTPQSPVPSSRSNSLKATKKSTTSAVANKIDISTLEKSIYATERVLYPPRRKRQSQAQQQTQTMSRNRDGQSTEVVDPIWRKIDINKKFRRPSECGYRSETNTICSKVLAAQSGYTSDYCNVNRRMLSGYKSDYSCKSRRSGYKSDYSLKAKSCGYRSDCSTRHRRKIRRKRRTKTVSSKPTLNDQDILMLAGLSLGHSDESSLDSSDKPQAKSKSPLKMNLASNSISNLTTKKPAQTKVPAQKSRADDNSSNQSERVSTKHKSNTSFDSMLLTMNDSVTTITSSIYKDDANSLKLDRIKPGLIRRRRSSAVSHCSSHCSTNSRHPFRRRRRRRLKSTTDHASESNLAKINQQIESLTTSFTSLCAIYSEKPAREKEKSSSQIAKSTSSRRTGKKRKINQENTEVPTVNATTTSKRRNKKTVQTKSPDDHKLPLKKRHYLLTPGEKSDNVNADEKADERTEPDNETDTASGKAVTPKKRHLLQTPVDLNDVVDSTDATSNSTCKDLQEIQASVSASITGETVKTTAPTKGNSQSKKGESSRKKSRLEILASKISSNTQNTVTETATKPTNTLKNSAQRSSKALTTKSAPKNLSPKSTQPTSKSKQTSANAQPLEHSSSTSKASNQRLNHVRISKESAPPPGVFEPSMDLELQIPFTEIPVPSLVPKPTANTNRVDNKASAKTKASTERGVVEKLLHRTGAAMKIGKRKRKKPNRTGFPTLKKKKKQIIKAIEIETETDAEAFIETNVILDQSKILTCEPKIILNCLEPAQLEKLREECDRVPSEGETAGTFIERNSKSSTTVVSTERHRGRPKAMGKKQKIAAKPETTQTEIDDNKNDPKHIGKRLKQKDVDVKTKEKQKENTVENVTAPRRGRPSLHNKEESASLVPAKVSKFTKQTSNSKEIPSKPATAEITKSPIGRNAKLKVGKKETETSKNQQEKVVPTLVENKKSSVDQSKSEKSVKRTVNGRIIATPHRRTALPVEPEKVENEDDSKNRKKSRREIVDENKMENQKNKHENHKRIGSPSIHSDTNVVEKKRARTEKNDMAKSPSKRDKVQLLSQSKPKSIGKETITDLKDIVPVDDWTRPMDQDPLPLEENIHYDDDESDDLIPIIDTKKSHTKPKKKYLVAGLFSNYYKTDMLLPSDKSKNSTDKKANDNETICGPHLPMPFFDKYLLQTQSDFTLPYDLWYAHDNDKLSGRNMVHSWNFKKIRTNIYADSVKPIQSPDLPQCSCKPDYECGDNCLNRLVYTECVPETCPCGDKCRNTKIQKHIVAPVERFMTQCKDGSSKGWGVKTNNLIKKGTYILEYVGEVVSEREFKERMATLYINDIHHYCLHLEGGLFIDGHRMGSDCRFVNHSCEPNCEMQKWSVNGLSRMALFASRDIRPGEELTYDYNFSLFNPAEGQVCRCDSQNCRGVIGGKSQRIRPIENKVFIEDFFLFLRSIYCFSFAFVWLNSQFHF